MAYRNLASTWMLIAMSLALVTALSGCQLVSYYGPCPSPENLPSEELSPQELLRDVLSSEERRLLNRRHSRGNQPANLSMRERFARLLDGREQAAESADSGQPQKRKSIAATLVKNARLPLPEREKPSNNRRWRPDLAVLPVADIRGDSIRLYHIRDCTYRTEEDYDVRYFDREFRLQDVRTVDFIVVPFQNTPALAHTMLSFGLANGEHFVVSVEGRLEQGEQYSTLSGAFNGYELMVVIGTERDLILLRTEVRKVDVYLYPTRVRPEQAQTLFVALLNRANQLARQPEFYDLLSNNCTTNIVDHINSLKPGYIPSDIRVVLPGHSDKLAYDLGLLAMDGPFDQIRAACRVNLAAHLHADSPDFSQQIRTR